MNVLELFCVLYMMLRSRAESTIVICKVADAAKCVKRVLIQSIATKKAICTQIICFSTVTTLADARSCHAAVSVLRLSNAHGHEGPMNHSRA